MRSDLIISICLIFIGIVNSADRKDCNLNIIAPSYNNFIGKKFVQIKEIDTMLSSLQFSLLDENKNYSINIYGHWKILNKWKNARFKYIFFTKKVGQQGAFPLEEILDIVVIDGNNFSDSASIWLDECTCRGQKDCETVAIYYHDERMADKGIRVKPQKVWRPNIATGKLEELSPESVRCGSQAPEEE